MRRAYVELPGPDGPWQLHYRTSGSGPPVVLLHPSPLSSAFLEPVATRLATRFSCNALDTPGYGLSDPLPASWDAQDMTPYVAALLAFVHELGIERPLIYGSATGAQIAVEFAKAYPQHCSGLLLENIALFSQDERQSIVANYFPDVTPKDDGSHLQTLWNMATRTVRYFPWFDDSEGADRRGANPPPALTEAMVRDQLLSGKDYERAYRAAFANEGPEALTGITVPTRIVQWRDSMLGEYALRLNDAVLPASITLVHAASGIEARMAAVEQAADELQALN